MLDIGKLVIELHQQREYRPVGVAVLYRQLVNGSRRYLIIESAKAPGVWGFPQGGIERGETIQQNLPRELAEELNIVFRRDIVDVKWAYLYQKLDAESTRVDKRGFSKGKAYIFTLARYIGNSHFTLQEEEVRNAEWLTYAEAVERFNGTRPEKAVLLRKGLEKVVKILEK